MQYIETELVVVLGHESCGAVGAAITPPSGAPKELNDLVKLYSDNYFSRLTTIKSTG